MVVCGAQSYSEYKRVCVCVCVCVCVPARPCGILLRVCKCAGNGMFTLPVESLCDSDYHNLLTVLCVSLSFINSSTCSWEDWKKMAAERWALCASRLYYLANGTTGTMFSLISASSNTMLSTTFPLPSSILFIIVLSHCCTR